MTGWPTLLDIKLLFWNKKWKALVDITFTFG